MIALLPSTDAEPEQSLRGKFRRGVAWNGVSRIGGRGIQFFVTVVLARLLVPADFGLAAMASTVTMLVAIVIEVGLSVVLVQKKDLTEDDVSTTFWTSMLLGLAMCLFCIAAAPLVAALFGSPAVRWILVWSSAGLLIGAAGVTPSALLVRRMDFKATALAEISSSVLYGVVAIAAALNGLGVWSLVIAGLTLAAVRVGVLLWCSRFRPRAVFDRQSLRAILPSGLRVLGTNLVGFVRLYLDYFLVGVALGPVSLGLYSMAFKLTDFPRLRLAGSITDVALPAMARMQDDEEPLRATYVRSLTAVSLVVFPLLAGLGVLAPDFVRLVYGQAWMGAVAPLRVLLAMGVLVVIADNGVTLLMAKGRSDVALRLSVLYLAVVSALVVAGLRWGIVGVAVGVSSAAAVHCTLVLLAVRRHGSIGWRQNVSAMRVPAVATALMLAALLGLEGASVALDATRNAVWLAGAVATGAVVFCAAILGFRLVEAEPRTEARPEPAPVAAGLSGLNEVDI